MPGLGVLAPPNGAPPVGKGGSPDHRRRAYWCCWPCYFVPRCLADAGDGGVVVGGEAGLVLQVGERAVGGVDLGGVAAGAIAHFLGNAIDNARSDATLCKYVPNMTQIKTKLTAMGSQLRGGDTSQVDSTNSSFTDLQHQTGFTPNDNATVPGVG